MNKVTIGLTEDVVLYDESGNSCAYKAKIDTGADTCSIDTHVAAKLGLVHLPEKRHVISSHGKSERHVVMARCTLGTITFRERFTLFDRSHLKYKILIGKNGLKYGFLIDPLKK